MADQAASAPQAGLSVDDDREEDVELPEPQTISQQANSATNHAGVITPAPPVPVASPQLASIATPPPPAAAISTAPARGDVLTPIRTSQPEAAPQSPSSAEIVTGLLQAAAPTPTTDNQILIAPPTPTNVSVATGSSVSARPTQAISPPPSPATQVAQAIVEPVKVIMTSPAQAGPSTPHVTTIQITPAELGRVEVRIERTSDGPAKIQLIAERPETLSRLVHDQSQLQQALDHVGITQESRTIEYSLAPANTAGGANSTSFFGNNASGGEPSGSGSPRQNNAYYNQNLNESDDNQLASPTQSRLVRTGIDITA